LFALAALTGLWAANLRAATIAPASSVRAVSVGRVSVYLSLLVAVVADVTAIGRGHDRAFDVWATVIAFTLAGSSVVVPVLAREVRQIGNAQRGARCVAVVLLLAAALLALHFG
jgi:MFS superfamily sulfate permease-like transporter